MRRLPLRIHSDLSVDDILVRFENLFGTLDLRVHSKTSLRQFPGSHHWHIRKEGDHGTLEFTFVPQKREAWLSVHDNRSGEWIDSAIKAIQRALDRRTPG